MGRQTIWGGAGKPPSREVMAAAAKAAHWLEDLCDELWMADAQRVASPFLKVV